MKIDQLEGRVSTFVPGSKWNILLPGTRTSHFLPTGDVGDEIILQVS